jgi:hypothetical protein
MGDSGEKYFDSDDSDSSGAQSGVALAIVIPAYKGRFLAEALGSLAAQTDRSFRVYVGDDCSPDDLAGICRGFDESLDLVYHRFPENLGKTSLSAQWDRCVALSREPWIWLFADDDLMDRECVAGFHRVLEQTAGAFDLYRFNTRTIDSAGRVIKINRPHPEHETALTFAYHRLRGDRDSYACEYVFSRTTYGDCGGMAHYPLAWCADDASWIRFSARTGIRTVAGPCVLWRRSGLNITAVREGTIPEKLRAAAMFSDELAQRFSSADFSRAGIPRPLFEEARQDWFFGQIQSLAPIPWRLWLNLPAVPKGSKACKGLPLAARLVYIHMMILIEKTVCVVKRLVDT